MERPELVRDWLYNNSLTAFVGALLMLLARSLSDKDINRDAASSSIQWTYPILDSVSPHLSFLHLPLSAILFVLAFALFVASTMRISPTWAILIGKWVSLLSPIFVWVGLLTAWLPLTGDLFTTEPLLGAVTFYVGFLFLVLMSVRPFDRHVSDRLEQQRWGQGDRCVQQDKSQNSGVVTCAMESVHVSLR